MPVALVRWPRDRDRLGELAALGLPRLLLVAADAPAPEVGDDQDWVRIPAGDRDVSARLAALRARTGGVSLEDAVVRTSLGAASLSPLQAAVAAVLLGEPGTVVPRAALESAAARHRPVTPRTLDGALHRLRRRLRPLGLDVTSSRGRGYAIGPRLDWPIGDIPLR
jgi:DNA-binding response OmpR family regulator